jgi:small-conductance mechanosensitive channel
MTELLDQKFWGNTHLDWLIAAAIIILTTLVLRMLQAVTRRRLSILARSTSTRWDDYVVELISRTKLLFWLIASLTIGTQWLELPESVQRGVIVTFVIALLIQSGIWGGMLIKVAIDDYRKKAQQEDPADVTTLGLIGLAGQTAVWSLVVLLILDNLGVNITALVAGLGIGGVAVALALQNILGDLFASLSIALDKPFVVGDFLMVGDLLGSVEKVGLKTSRLRSLSGEQLVFSNTDLLGSRIRNFGRMFERRVVFNLGVTYETPRDKLELIPNIVREAVEAEEGTRFDRSHFSKYADYSLNFETVYYVLTADYNLYMDIQQAIYFTIHRRFEKEGIEFAYPTQTLLLSRSGREMRSPQ